MKKWSEINNLNEKKKNINILNENKNIDNIIEILENAKYIGIDKQIENLKLEKKIITERKKIEKLKEMYNNDSDKISIILEEKSKKMSIENLKIKYLATKGTQFSNIFLKKI